jgi:MFS family permease
MRTFDVSSAAAGAWLALAYGLGGTLGVLCGGYIGDGIVKRTRNQRWYALWPATLLVATLPSTFVLYLTPSAPLAVTALIASVFFGHAYLGPVAALMQNLAGPRRRAMAAAFYLFLVNLVSMGLGPVAVGMLSDGFGPWLGRDALRYALLAIVAGTTLLAALHFLLAARTLQQDLEHARDNSADVDQ